MTILGDRWSWEVVGAAFQGRKRFDDIQASTGMATNILADRLRRLSADGIFTRRVYQDNPLRHEYVLTEKGRDFFPATVMLLRWGDRWMAGKRGPPMLLFHKTCGGPLNPQVTCSACGNALDAHEVTYTFADGTRQRRGRGQREPPRPACRELIYLSLNSGLTAVHAPPLICSTFTDSGIA